MRCWQVHWKTPSNTLQKPNCGVFCILSQPIRFYRYARIVNNLVKNISPQWLSYLNSLKQTCRQSYNLYGHRKIAIKIREFERVCYWSLSKIELWTLKHRMTFIFVTVLLMHEVSPERGQPCCHLQGWPCPGGHTAAGCCGSRHSHPWGTCAQHPLRCTSSPLSPSSHTPCAEIAWRKSELYLTCTTTSASGQLHLMLGLLHKLYVLAGACH